MLRCYWLSQKHPAAASHPLITDHLAWRHARRVRRIRRAAGAAIVCAAVGAPLAAAGLPFFLSPPSSPPAAGSSGHAFPEGRWETPNSATGTPTPIPEPSSLALLAGAVAAMIWRLTRDA